MIRPVELRPDGIPGDEVTHWGGICGYDDGVIGGPPCGKPAVLHGLIFTNLVTGGAYGALACENHAPNVRRMALDHPDSACHDFRPECADTDAMWCIPNDPSLPTICLRVTSEGEPIQ